MRCSGCGQNLQGNATKSGEGYRYYRETAERRGIDCTQPQVSVRADALEAEVDRIVTRFEMPAVVRERVLQTFTLTDCGAV